MPLKPTRKRLNWNDALYGTCGCGQWARLAEGECAECHDANHQDALEYYYLGKIRELEDEVNQLMAEVEYLEETIHQLQQEV